MIKTKGNEAWTTTPETHRLMFKLGEEAEGNALYYTSIIDTT